MKTDDVKNCWREEERRISQSVTMDRDAQLQTLRSSLDSIRTRRLVRIGLWCILMPVLLLFVFLPNMKNDGSVLFYAAASVFVLLLLLFAASYAYTVSGLWKIDLAEPLTEVQRKIVRLERTDKIILIFRLIAIPIVLLCAYKIFGMGTLALKPIYIFGMFAVIFAIAYRFGIAIKYRLPKEYSGIKPFSDQDEQ